MNGLSTLLILALFGQVGGNLDFGSESRKFGWQINTETKELEYLIQISPAELPLMQDRNYKQDMQSKIPRELVGRVQRVVVKIGEEVLPRNPPLSEIATLLPKATDPLLPNRLQELESGVVPVNNPNPQSGYSNPGANPANNANFGNPATTNNLGSALGNPGFGANTNPALGGMGSSIGTANNLGLGQAPSNLGRNNNAPGSLYDSISQRGGIGSSRFQDTAPAGSRTGGYNSNTYDRNYDRLADNRGSYAGGGVPDLRDPSSLQNNNWNSTNNNYGYNGPLRNDGYSTGQNNTGNSNLNYGTPGLGGVSNRSNTGYANNGDVNPNDPYLNSNQYNNPRGWNNNGFADNYLQNRNSVLDPRLAGNGYADPYQNLPPASGYLASLPGTNGPRSDLPSTSISSNNSALDRDSALAQPGHIVASEMTTNNSGPGFILAKMAATSFMSFSFCRLRSICGWSIYFAAFTSVIAAC
jgi:hypothetical protein